MTQEAWHEIAREFGYGRPAYIMEEPKRAFMEIARLRSELAAIKAERDAYKNTASSFERRLAEATKAGTPYARERDAMNSLIIERDLLKAELGAMKGFQELLLSAVAHTVKAYDEWKSGRIGAVWVLGHVARLKHALKSPKTPSLCISQFPVPPAEPVDPETEKEP